MCTSDGERNTVFLMIYFKHLIIEERNIYVIFDGTIGHVFFLRFTTTVAASRAASSDFMRRGKCF